MSNIDWDKLRDELVEAIVAVLRPHVSELTEMTDQDAPERAPSN